RRALDQRDLHVFTDVEAHRPRESEVTEDRRPATDGAGLDAAADIHHPRFVEDDRTLDLGALDAGVDTDRCVRADVRARNASARADDARADDHAARDLRRRVDLDPPLDSVVAVAERLGGN